MDAMQSSHLLELPPNAVQEIRKLYNLDNPDRLKEAIDILEEWLKKQDHILKKDFKRRFLELTIICCKGSLEKAKQQIDRLCTFRTLLPQFFIKSNLKTECSEILDIARLALLPKVTNDLCRVVIVKFSDKALAEKHCLEYCQYNIILTEYVKAHDYVNGFIIVIDFEQTNIADLVAFANPVIMQQSLSITVEGYGARMKRIYLLTQSKLVDVLIKMAKQFLSEKISNRITVTKTIEVLQMAIPKEILPKEYGGKERSIEELAAEWVEELSTKEHVEYMKMMSKACTDEKLRRTGQFNEEYMGIPGSFRNMTVD